MGSLPRLKIKDEIKYRKGSTNESSNCKACANFKRGLYEFHTSAGLRIEHRCSLIGMKESRRYHVQEDYTCDRQQIGQSYQKQIDEWNKPFKGPFKNEAGIIQ